jgi:Bacterial PH domain
MRPAFDFDARATLENELGPQERLLWAGRPRQGFVLRAADVFLIPFSLLWGGFVVFWEFTAVSNKAPFFFALWGVPFLLAGCYFVFGRFIADARQRAKTSYGLTNERVIIVSGVFRRNVKSLNLRTLTDVSLSERGDGSGTITFGQLPALALSMQGFPWPGMPVVPSFELIPDAKEVYDTLRTAQRET